MRYWFKLSEESEYMDAIINGEDRTVPTLYPETPGIVSDYENPVSDWWPVSYPYKEPEDFATLKDAQDAFFTAVDESLFSRLYDC